MEAVMRTYVLGAGASFPIYPLGGGLFTAIDEYLRRCGPCFDRFDYKTDWPKLKDWLDTSSNPLLRQAYRNGNIEQIFTVLDLAESLISNSLSDIFFASKKGAAAVKAAEANHDLLTDDIGEYRHQRSILLWAMEAFFLAHNDDDLMNFGSSDWKGLRELAARLKPGDVVVTFNYDSTVERVLLHLGKWAPSDGYGTEIAFQKNEYDGTSVTFTPSAVKVLHLHGAVGWYEKPPTSTALLETEIALDPLLLRGLGIHCVDACLPFRPPNEKQIMLHPSFLKVYRGEGHSNRIFSQIWKDALHALQNADEVTIIGYSLPDADSAAWTLLHTGCARGQTVIVNPSKSVLTNNYAALLNIPILAKPMTMGEWLAST
jgi:hypothetical protein